MRAWLTLAIAAASLAALPDTARGATWVEVKSPYFTVISDAGERRAREVAWQFEQIRAAIVTLWPWARVDFPLDVIVFATRNETSMKGLVPHLFEGRDAIRPGSVFMSSPMAHYIAVRSDIRLDSKGDVNPYRSSYWSYMALVIQTSFGRNLPPWYWRGLAQVFSNTVVREDELRVGQIVPGDLNRLRTLPRPTLDVLLEASAESHYLRDGERMAEFDAAASGLVHYLMFGEKGQNLVRMNQLAYALRQGADAKEALARVYGSLKAIQEGWSRYIDQSLYVFQKIPADVSVDLKAFSGRELLPAHAAAALARFHAGMRRPVEAREQLAAASDAPAAAEVEGFLLEREKKRDEARAAYARASDAGAASFFGEYRLAMLLWPEGTDQPADPHLADIEKRLRRAVSLNPRFAPAHALLAQTLTLRSRAHEAVPFAQQAVTLSPTDSFSYESLARVYWALGQRVDAAAAAKRALGVAGTDAARQNAQQLLDFYTRQPN